MNKNGDKPARMVQSEPIVKPMPRGKDGKQRCECIAKGVCWKNSFRHSAGKWIFPKRDKWLVNFAIVSDHIETS